MSRVSTYLNFMGNAEEAFTFYKELFGTEFVDPIMRLGDAPGVPVADLPAEEHQLVMHVSLPITAGHILMGTDLVASMGHQLHIGNNTTIHLELDTHAEADRLYAGLSEASTEGSPPADMFWGAYWGTCLDRFGVRWMISCPTDAP